ncbi:hypothetical protein DSO57_1020034 [Entomophthora muscae]|uniref:Uncharacterized protein n=1 Tax=Entomophthora muscae TaxID=34485 RepID=A0ACC2RIM7_9FUNG|nr:hypothetical protein DSO57_1020034 [Entomophthora muscae]
MSDPQSIKKRGNFIILPRPLSLNWGFPDVPFDQSIKYASFKNKVICRNSSIKYWLWCPPLFECIKDVEQLFTIFKDITRLELCQEESSIEVGFATLEARDEAYNKIFYSHVKVIFIKPCEEIPTLIKVSSVPSTLDLKTFQDEFYTGLQSYGRITAATINRSKYSSKLMSGGAVAVIAQKSNSTGNIPSTAFLLSSPSEPFHVIQSAAKPCRYCLRFIPARGCHKCTGQAFTAIRWGD